MGFGTFLNKILGGGQAPDPPDYSPIAEASKEMFDESLKFYREMLDFAKASDAQNQERLDRVLEVQLPVMEAQYQNFLKDRQRFEETFQPVEDQLVVDALTYDSPDRIEQEQGRLLADTNKAFDAQREAALQQLESYGVDPTQTRYAALDRMARIGQAAASAQALNAARLQRENTGRALRGEVVNIGRGYPGQIASSASQAVGAGNSAVGAGLNTAQTAAQLRQASLGGLNTGNNSVANWTNAFNTGFQNRLAEWNANFASHQAALGNGMELGGMAAGYFAADGGEIEAPALDASGVDDNATIRVSDGEYVVPADVVRKKGTEFFDKLVEKYHTPADQQRAQGAALPLEQPIGPAQLNPPQYADGGAVPTGTSTYTYDAEGNLIGLAGQGGEASGSTFGDKLAKMTSETDTTPSGADSIRPMTYKETLDPYYVRARYDSNLQKRFMEGFSSMYGIGG